MISGSMSARPAARRPSSVSWDTAIDGMLLRRRERLGGGHGTLAEHSRLATRQIEHGGRCPWQVAAVDDSGDGGPDLVRDVSDRRGSGAS